MTSAVQIETETEWQNQKLPRIGSSDARAIFGCGYDGESAATVYDRMVHGIKKSFGAAQIALMNEGRILEPATLRLFAAKNPEWDVNPTEGFCLTLNPKFPHLCCTLDAWASKGGTKVVVEAKFEANAKWEEYVDGQLPLKHYLQVQHQLIVTGWSGGFLVSLVRGRYEQRWLPRDEALIEQMLITYDRFMDDVRNRRRPEGAPPVRFVTPSANRERQTAKYLGSAASKVIREALRNQEQMAVLERDLQNKRGQIHEFAKGSEFVVLDDQTVVKLGKRLDVKPKLPQGVKVTV